MRARYGDGGGPSFASMSFHAGSSRRESERSSASGTGGGALSARESERSSGEMMDDLLERGVRRGRTSDLERLEEMMLKEAIRLSMEESNGTKAATTATATQGTADGMSTSAATSSDAGTGLSPTTVIGGADTSSSLSGASQGQPVSPKRSAGQGMGASASARLANAISGTTTRSPLGAGAGTGVVASATTMVATPPTIKKDMRMTAPYRRDAEKFSASNSRPNGDGDNDDEVDFDDDDDDDDEDDDEEDYDDDEEGEEVSEKRYHAMLADPNLPRMIEDEDADAEVQLQLAIAMSLAESPDKTSSKEKSTTVPRPRPQPPPSQPSAVSTTTMTSSTTSPTSSSSSSGQQSRLSPSAAKSSSSSPVPTGKISPVPSRSPSRDPSIRAQRIAAHSSAFDGAYELPFDVKKPKTPPLSPAPPALTLAQSEVAKKDLGGLLEKIDQALGTPPSQSKIQSRSISPSAEAATTTSFSSSGMYAFHLDLFLCVPFTLSAP